eukprot:TRINITY_DN5072_c0_g2_i3.p1 TRINITY_DN5072_c0_g2~~TRINITY_DN5072_c0_g2_i3.p1  ORF type:complete len:740 (+),score=158.88 TRINITY_DN5072_c0_g2_i3:74-2293(+)
MCLPKSKRRRVMTVMTCRPWPMGRCFALSVLLGVGVGQHDGGVVPAQVTLPTMTTVVNEVTPASATQSNVLTEAVSGALPAGMALDCTSDFQNRALAWSSAKTDWCCKVQGIGCLDLFDCMAGAANAAVGWSTEKKTWCCAKKGVGCSNTFDCAAGVANAAVGWSEEKKTWCCTNQGVGCADEFDCNAGIPNKEIGWSLEKKTWCCQQKQIGCEGDEVVLSTFGPENCIDISRSVKGTCVFTTTCSQMDITDTNFAFVCFNPGTTMPHAMHSFGRGALESEETFDTGVRCKTCSTTEAAFASGQISRALKVMPSDTVPTDVLPVSAVPAYNDATISTQRVAGTRTTVAREAVKVQNTVSLDTVLHDVLPVSAVPAYTDVSIPSPPPCERRKEVAKEPCEVAKPCEAKRNMRPADATFYGPENCVMTFRSATGTCIVETDCADVNLTSFNMGVTCVENEQVHTRYLFGEGSFDSLEVFDSGIYCDVCLGVSEDTFRVNNILPVDVKPVSVGAPSIDVVIQSQQVGTPLANDVVPIKQDTMDATTADVQSVASNNDAVIQPQQVGNNDAVIQPQQVGTPVANDSVPAQKEMAPNIDGTTLMKTVLAKDIEALSSDVSVLEKDVVNASKQMNMPVPRPRRAASPFISRSSGWSSAKVSESWRSSSAGSASSGSSSASGPIASSASGSSRSSSGSQSSGSSSASGSRSSSSANGSRPSPAPRPSTTVKPDTAKASAKARPTPR